MVERTDRTEGLLFEVTPRSVSAIPGDRRRTDRRRIHVEKKEMTVVGPVKTDKEIEESLHGT